MIKRAISEDDLEFMECFYDPIAHTEVLYSDLDSQTVYNEKFSEVRHGQIPILSFEYLVDENPELNNGENFNLREGAGNLWCFGGRNWGKTMVGQKVDLPMSLVLNDGWAMGFSSYDAAHVKGVMDVVCNIFENHPILKHFKSRIRKGPDYDLQMKNHSKLNSVNMTLQGSNPGGAWFQHHFKKVVIEEASFETEEVYKKRVDSKHELGCIERCFGMTNFTKYTPAGQVFNDLDKKNWISNVPQYVNPNWNDDKKKKAIKKYGGQNSINYKIFVEAKIVETGESVFDMERVRRLNYDSKERLINNIEITKENFGQFQMLLGGLESPKQADQVIAGADIGGDSAPTEIHVYGRIDERYRYLVNITLYNLTAKQQSKVFLFIANKFNLNFLGMDTTDGTGRAIYRELEEHIPKKNLVWCGFNEKIRVAFETDEDGNQVFDNNGNPKYIEEYISEWSVKHLQTLLYEGKFHMMIDYKLDKQLNSVTSMQSGNRTIYKCINENNEDHSFQAMQVVSIMIWSNQFNLVEPVRKKKHFKGGVF